MRCGGQSLLVAQTEPDLQVTNKATVCMYIYNLRSANLWELPNFGMIFRIGLVFLFSVSVTKFCGPAMPKRR
jgi:hypothetical protein